MKRKKSAHFFISSFCFLFAFIIILTLGHQKVFAATTVNDTYTNSPTQYTTAPGGYNTPNGFVSVCPDLPACNTSISLCWNSQSLGVTDCGTACSGGSPWTKYAYLGICMLTGESCDRITGICNYACTRLYESTSTVYSTADKCSNGSSNPPAESYLRPGHCDGSIGTTYYKTCCTNTTPSLVSTSSCVSVTPYSNAPYPPYDGVCPAGSTDKFCGFGGYPACGQDTCGPIATPTNGGWSIPNGTTWNNTCSVTACGSTGTKTRTCNNPTPANGGAECQRDDGSLTTPTNRTETQTCNTQACSTPTACVPGTYLTNCTSTACGGNYCSETVQKCKADGSGYDPAYPQCTGDYSCGACNTPTPACGATCTYSQSDGTCHQGNCLDGSQNCSTNNNCGYVANCSSGTQVSCGTNPPAKYSCSNNSCVRDDVNGSYTASDCNTSCNDPCPGGNCTTGSRLCPVMHPFAQIRNVTKNQQFPTSVTYKGVTYNLTSPGACAGSGSNCGLAIESTAQTINADPGDVLEMRVMVANEGERSGAIHSVEVRFWGDKGITAYPNGFADDEAGNAGFCTNSYFNNLTNFQQANISCVGGGSMGCPWTYTAVTTDAKSSAGEPQKWGTGIVSTNWNTARYQVPANAVSGTKAGITAVAFPNGGVQTPSGQCFWENNGSSSNKDFRWKTDSPMCPFTNDMFYDSLPLTVKIGTSLPVSGYVKNSQTGVPIPNVAVQVYDDAFNKLGILDTQTVSTGPDGHWEVKDFVRTNDFYAVRVTGNLANPQTWPTGYVPPAKTCFWNTTTNQCETGHNWNYAANPNTDVPLGSASYEGQLAGSNDCAGFNGSGVDDRCSFVYDPPPPPAPTVDPICNYQITQGEGAQGSGIAISWGASDPAVTWVDISDDSNFGSYSNKPVSGNSTNADGFNMIFNPGQTYYVRLWNGAHSPTAFFIAPSGYNIIDAPPASPDPAIYYTGTIYRPEGWATFCSALNPNGTNRNRVDLYVCDKGTWNNCRGIGSATSKARGDVVNLPWTCGNLNSNSDGWSLNWTPDSSFAGDKTLRVASINDPGTTCVVWNARNITITPSSGGAKYTCNGITCVPNANPNANGAYSSLADCNANTACGSGGPNTPWIQTTGGDVHSNTGINTPGGP